MGGDERASRWIRGICENEEKALPSCIFCAPSVGWVLTILSLLVGLAILSGRIDGIRFLVFLGKTKACVTCHIFAILSLMLCFRQRVFQNGRDPKSLFASEACLRGKSRICRRKSRNHNSGRQKPRGVKTQVQKCVFPISHLFLRML